MSFLERARSRLNIENAAALLAIAFGLALRVRQYALNLSFWLDEAMLALNITGRSFAGLAKPLAYDQGAPLGFLWSVKLSQVLLGDHEYSLRLVAFLSGCLALFVLWRVARQITGPVGVLFALLIFASSRHLIYYGVQVKQYAVDVLITLLLYLLGLALWNGELSKRKYWLAAILGGISIWMSHPAVFTLGGVGTVLIAAAAWKKDWRKVLTFSSVAFFWALNFLALYILQYRNLAANSFLTGFWAEFFMPLNSTAPEWALDRLAGLFYNPGGVALDIPSIVLLVLFGLGMLSLLLRKNPWVSMFLLSLVFTLAASGLGKYPFGGRLGMFAVPGLLICVGEAVELPRRWLAAWPAPGLALSVLLVGILTYNSLAFALELTTRPKMQENIAPTMAFLQANYRPGDVIYLYRMAIPAFRYYAPRYGLGSVPYMNGADHHLDRSGYQAELDQLAGNKRVWLLFSHLTDPEYVNDRDFILAYANQIGDRKREFSDPGTLINLYLYSFAR